MIRYSPRPWGDYANKFPAESEIQIVKELQLTESVAVWNWFWLLRPEFDLVFSGVPWHLAVPIIPDLVPAIIRDIRTTGMLHPACSHPLVLGEWLLDNRRKVTLKSVDIGCNKIYKLPNPYDRCSEVAGRMISESPYIKVVSGEYQYSTVKMP